jgi:hypothetical protein
MDLDVIFWVSIGLWALTWGGFSAWLADQKGRDPLSWFGLGLLFGPVALLSVGLAPLFSDSLEERFADE